MNQQIVRVLIVDDSAVVRNVLSEVLDSDPGIRVIATAADPYAAVERMKHEAPDVIFLDVEMPRMDGVTFLRRIMQQHPIPVVICSSLTAESSQTAMEALEAGAVEVIAKPKLGCKEFLEESRAILCQAARSAARARVSRREPVVPRVEPKLSADVMVERPAGRHLTETTEKVVLIGASTGGVEALTAILSALPPDTAGIVIVQHMPEMFTRTFAERLNSLSAMTVKEAENGDSVIRGRALLAPGNRHTLLKRSGARYYVEVREGPLVSRHRPSVDVLFRTGARYAGPNAVGVLLTGMGDDGAQGLLEMRQAGARTVAQDEKSCIVFGMPHEAIERGAAEQVVSLARMAPTILSLS